MDRFKLEFLKCNLLSKVANILMAELWNRNHTGNETSRSRFRMIKMIFHRDLAGSNWTWIGTTNVDGTPYTTLENVSS